LLCSISQGFKKSVAALHLASLQMGFFTVPREAEGSAIPAILMGGFVGFGGILFGYDTGTIGGILAMGMSSQGRTAKTWLDELIFY
jgi:hypothetical protein